ncbi:nucleotidyltransferase family protein [Paenibacillus roseipurpureus]|uniref:Nucleotidyltransferase family protein n=1 Tax=Paenibacillus roseopurpureus TaxID=2918901 RepID=A0AA96LSK0_9BACL|nr:nucleotidyltransferase family protein [Paenibacillus sp. MBLB1832]WNR45776.1 nucleotidyltransferase family protein [Paenibacillus sp. MBLB1832]
MEAIILAAGLSSRAHDFKMTLQLGTMTVLEHTVSKFEGICKRVIVVSGFQCERIQEATSEMQKKNKYNMDIVDVVNPHFDQGMFSSVQRGCREVEASSFFITPGDCPLVQKETIWKLAQEKGEVVIPSYQWKGGHPIKLTGEIKTRILEAKPDSNLRAILQLYEKNYMNIDDPGVLMDLDTPKDFEKATEYYNECSRILKLP